MPNEELEQNDAERVQVAPSVHTVPATLLGRHVVRRATDQPWLRDRAFLAHDRSEAEIDDLDEVLP